MAKTHPRYAQMEFPEWEFEEFPMMLYPGAKDPRKPEYHAEGKRKGSLVYPGVIVQDEEEAKALLAGTVTAVTDTRGAMRLETHEDRMSDLHAEASRLGITFDKRWSETRLQAAIDDAKAAKEVV